MAFRIGYIRHGGIYVISFYYFDIIDGLMQLLIWTLIVLQRHPQRKKKQNIGERIGESQEQPEVQGSIQDLVELCK